MAKTRREGGAPGAWAETETETGIQREAKRGSGGELGLRAHGLNRSLSESQRPGAQRTWASRASARDGLGEPEPTGEEHSRNRAESQELRVGREVGTWEPG